MNKIIFFILIMLFSPAFLHAGEPRIKFISHNDLDWVSGEAEGGVGFEVKSEDVPEGAKLDLIFTGNEKPMPFQKGDGENIYVAYVPEFIAKKMTFTARILKNKHVVASDTITIYGGARFGEGLGVDYVPGKSITSTFKKVGSVMDGATLDIPDNYSQEKVFFGLAQSPRWLGKINKDYIPIGPSLHLFHEMETLNKSQQNPYPLAGKYLIVTLPLDYKARDIYGLVSEPAQRIDEKLQKNKVAVLVHYDPNKPSGEEISEDQVISRTKKFIKFKIQISNRRTINFIPVIKLQSR